MTLFWHNHFVSSQQKVRVARLMYRQNETLRATRSAISARCCTRSRAIRRWSSTSTARAIRKGAPNENFAREVMELFTLGEGHYTEQDVKEAARAFTGWSLDRETRQFCSAPALHDYGTKTVLGARGAFDGDAVLDLLLAQPETRSSSSPSCGANSSRPIPILAKWRASPGASRTRITTSVFP
jgi:uncharacterized protein (DUF1800 family)